MIFLKKMLMTITKHAHIYNFHTSKLNFEEICFLKFLSIQLLVTVELLTNTKAANRGSPTQSCRSAVGHQHQPKSIPPRVPIAHCTRSRAPRMIFLQLWEVQAHRSVLEAKQYAQMSKEERIHTATSSAIHLEPAVNKTVHKKLMQNLSPNWKTRWKYGHTWWHNTTWSLD